ncbi:Acyl-CoA thioester hydrolase YbgC [Symmachiella dynata]|uniref:Acyl-CoA thioester hydrolase YbgC n=1 Tax=Symmachiella dynata TaxID=2527995 RepID=A0A517ZWT1_9PLAN|nr:thioesterase family protein [Symmachiella dynata]QDT51247.1 Acyl-CoA thioester hydrolase YbgC [Symmachiella dynata]QDU46949.1 Acyl-CoA thioester hydrolase YbgC [Symmachiella dynata]
MLREHEIQVRVRYSETDAMGYLHHANYLNFFEMGRTELLRASGGNYRSVEEQGLFIVVVKMEVRYRAPARYDDMLTVKTQLIRSSPAKLIHNYQVFRDDVLLCEAETLLGCVDAEGKIQRMPDFLSEQS